MNIEAALERTAAGGHITDDHNDRDDDHDQGREYSVTAGEYVRLGLMALVIVASLTGWWRHWMLRDWLACTATLVGGFPIFKEAWENLRKRRMTMELSMTLALVAALCIGQFLTALVIAFFVLFAEMVEGYTVGSGRRAIQTLIDALPRQVRVRSGCVHTYCHAQFHFDHRGDHRRWRVWSGGGHATGHSRRNRKRCASRRHHAGWALPRAAQPHRHYRSGQNRHAHAWNSRSDRRASNQ